MHLPTYLTMLSSAEQTLAGAHQEVADGHPGDADVRYTCADFASRCTRHAEALTSIINRYEKRRQPEPDRLHPPGLVAARTGPIGLLRDLQDLYQLASLVDITWTLIGQAAAGARDRALLDIVASCHPEITAQLTWLRMRMKAAAPQTLLVAP